jgi:hypothetical protein
MPAPSVLPSLLPHRPPGVISGSTSDEHAPWSPTLAPVEATGVQIQPECEFDLDAALRRLVAWRSPLRTYGEHTLQILPRGAYAYSALVQGMSSTIGEHVGDLLTVTSSFVIHAAPFGAGADLSPSFASHIASVNDTTPRTFAVRRNYLKSRFSVALADAKSEEFEVGTDSNFSQRIARLVLMYGGDAFGTLAATLTDARVPVTVLGELFRAVGRIRHSTTKDDQREFLLRFLGAPDVRVRHVAATGLAELDDPATIPALQTALTAERSERLRMHLQLVLDQLQATSVALRRR